MSASILRLKRKASCEPLEGLVVAVKKSKCDEALNTNEVYFKFATTLKSDKESIKDQIQAVLARDKEARFSKWRDPKYTRVIQKNVTSIYDKLKKECKAVSKKKRFDHLNNRRLIFTETVPVNNVDDSLAQSAEVRELFQLYDIIEESEEPKKQIESEEIKITCNGETLIREKSTDYVYDVYIADGQIDHSFVENTVSLRPCGITDDDIYSGDSDNNSETYEDEDDSNDENNWRNEYPEDEDSHSERGSEEEYCNDPDVYCDELKCSFNEDDSEEEVFSSDDIGDEAFISKTVDSLEIHQSD